MNKNKIININAPQPFKYFKNIHTFGNKKTLQNYILNDIDIFISSGIDNNFLILVVYMYYSTYHLYQMIV